MPDTDSTSPARAGSPSGGARANGGPDDDATATDDPGDDATRHPVASLWMALRRILRLARPYRLRLGVALALTMLTALVGLAVPLGLRALLDAVFEETNRGLLDRLTLALIALFLVQAALSFGGRYLLGWTGERVVADLRQRLYRHLHRLHLGFFADRRTGDLTSRLTNDVGSVRSAVTQALAELLTQSLSLAGSVVLMAILNWRLSLIIFVVVPLVSVIAVVFGRKIRAIARGIQDKLADTTAIAEEAIGAVRLVKAFGRSRYEAERYATAVDELFEAARYRVLVSATFSATVGLLFFGALVAVFWYGGREVLAGRLTAGDLVAFIFYAFNIARSVGGMSRLYTLFNSAAGATERLFGLLDTPPRVTDAPDARPLPPIRGHVRFEDVTFSYEADRAASEAATNAAAANAAAADTSATNEAVAGDGAPTGHADRLDVLKGIALDVPAGQSVALVGPSGAGKTTLMSLLPRFYDPQRGRVIIDGHDLRGVTLESLRQQVAMVSQDIHLFNTTIRENIRYGRLDATDEEVEDAARAANAHAFIAALPAGYDAEVGERGVKLSGGQRQRLAIARALLRDARLLLLDEATSSLDSASEALVQEALNRLMAGRTTFIIAHRLATVQDADRIVVLDDGRVVQTGTHADLIATDGLYRSLAALQFDPIA